MALPKLINCSNHSLGEGKVFLQLLPIWRCLWHSWFRYRFYKHQLTERNCSNSLLESFILLGQVTSENCYPWDMYWSLPSYRHWLQTCEIIPVSHQLQLFCIRLQHRGSHAYSDFCLSVALHTLDLSRILKSVNVELFGAIYLVLLKRAELSLDLWAKLQKNGCGICNLTKQNFSHTELESTCQHKLHLWYSHLSS